MIPVKPAGTPGQSWFARQRDERVARRWVRYRRHLPEIVAARFTPIPPHRPQAVVPVHRTPAARAAYERAVALDVDVPEDVLAQRVAVLAEMPEVPS